MVAYELPVSTRVNKRELPLLKMGGCVAGGAWWILTEIDIDIDLAPVKDTPYSMREE